MRNFSRTYIEHFRSALYSTNFHFIYKDSSLIAEYHARFMLTRLSDLIETCFLTKNIKSHDKRLYGSIQL